VDSFAGPEGSYRKYLKSPAKRAFSIACGARCRAMTFGATNGKMGFAGKGEAIGRCLRGK